VRGVVMSGWKLGWMTSKVVSTLKDILILNVKMSCVQKQNSRLELQQFILMFFLPVLSIATEL
jgi:hypothetical protein